MTGVRTETPDQFIERMTLYNQEYVETYIKNVLENSQMSCTIYDSMQSLENSIEQHKNQFDIPDEAIYLKDSQGMIET